jgi:hypothetical protein
MLQRFGRFAGRQSRQGNPRGDQPYLRPESFRSRRFHQERSAGQLAIELGTQARLAGESRCVRMQLAGPVRQVNPPIQLQEKDTDDFTRAIE